MSVFLGFPNRKKIQTFLKKQSQLAYSYPEIGSSANDFTEGYDNDQNKIYLGTGRMVWENAKTALFNWQQFPSQWTRVVPKSTALVEGKDVAVLFHLFGLWWLNSCRIVYTFNEENRFGFAYGTLPGHVEKGEECFWIEKGSNGDVHYHIRAFSKPRSILTKIGYPIARWYQARFVKESLERMKDLANQMKKNG